MLEKDLTARELKIKQGLPAAEAVRKMERSGASSKPTKWKTKAAASSSVPRKDHALRDVVQPLNMSGRWSVQGNMKTGDSLSEARTIASSPKRTRTIASCSGSNHHENSPSKGICLVGPRLTKIPE